MSRGPALISLHTLFRSTTDLSYEINRFDRMFEVSPDGKRFLFSVNAADDASGDLVIVQNFRVKLREVLASGETTK
jgi:hypothetical protein